MGIEEAGSPTLEVPEGIGDEEMRRRHIRRSQLARVGGNLFQRLSQGQRITTQFDRRCIGKILTLTGDR
jgi:hypothetical protein